MSESHNNGSNNNSGTPGTSSCTSLLRIGGPHTDATQLLQNAIWQYFQRSKTKTNEKTNSIPDRSREMIFQLENKYFTANVQLTNLKDQESSTNTDKANNQHYAAEDGIIIVFDAIEYNPDYFNGSSFHDLQTIVSDESNRNSQESSSSSSSNYLLQLCVGISIQSIETPEQWRGKNHEDEYSKRILWCLDHGYEYIEADISYDGQRKGHDDRDKDGFARIIEAIEGTVWSSAIQNKNRTSTTIETTIKTQLTTQSRHPATTIVPSSLTSPNPFLSSQPSHHDIDTDDDDDVYLQEPETPEEALKREQHSQESKAYTELESLMKEANRIRYMSQRGDLTDDDRRARAAHAATLMMNLMDQMGLNEEQDDCSHCSSSSSESNSNDHH
jgi:Alpha and gamma adaptin binding protein p34